MCCQVSGGIGARSWPLWLAACVWDASGAMPVFLRMLLRLSWCSAFCPVVWYTDERNFLLDIEVWSLRPLSPCCLCLCGMHFVLRLLAECLTVNGCGESRGNIRVFCGNDPRWLAHVVAAFVDYNMTHQERGHQDCCPEH